MSSPDPPTPQPCPYQVDEKILELQRRKQLLCSSALGGADADADGAGGSKGEARRLRLADLRLCFERAPAAAAP